MKNPPMFEEAREEAAGAAGRIGSRVGARPGRRRQNGEEEEKPSTEAEEVRFAPVKHKQNCYFQTFSAAC
jgi:hypothetical protein